MLLRIPRAAFGLAIWLACGLGSIALAQPTHSPQASLHFRNGDVLYGSLRAIDPAGAIHWQHAGVTGPIDFTPTNVEAINLVAPPPPAVSQNACTLHLVNGDVLPGSLAGCTPNALQLSTWYAGPLDLPRAKIAFIEITPPPAAVVFAGLTGLDGWTQGRSSAAPEMEAGAWSYRDGAFYAGKAASIARDVKLPDECAIQFDLDWRGSINEAFALFTDSLQPIALANRAAEPPFGAFYSLQLNVFYVDLLGVNQHDAATRDLGMVPFPSLGKLNHAHFEVRASKPRQRVRLYLNDGLVKEWVDPNFAAEGTGLRIVHQGSGSGMVKLSNLRVTAWDSNAEDGSGPVEAGHELARLRNGDRINGSLAAVANGQITMSVGNTKVTVPWERLKRIELGSLPVTATNSPPGQVIGTFVQGGTLTFRLQRWDDTGVQIDSPDFGPAKFNPSVFTRLEFSR